MRKFLLWLIEGQPSVEDESVDSLLDNRGEGGSHDFDGEGKQCLRHDLNYQRIPVAEHQGKYGTHDSCFSWKE
eukprot:349802-Amorphochlora_amoeboformis.AAC.2